VSVYFVQGKTTGLVKVGYAKGDPQIRVDSFRVGCPEELEFLGSVHGGRDVEAAFHKVFAMWRVRGEWFWPHPSLMEQIGRRDLGRWFAGGPEAMRFAADIRAGKPVPYRRTPELFMASDHEFSTLTFPC
jgi:hypothetical protein